MAKRKNKAKTTKRILIFGTLCVLLDCCIIYNYGNTWLQIINKNDQKQDLGVQLEQLKKDSKELTSTVEKLQDPEYVAKYAREKRLYSGKNEYIIRIK